MTLAPPPNRAQPFVQHPMQPEYTIRFSWLTKALAIVVVAAFIFMVWTIRVFAADGGNIANDKAIQLATLILVGAPLIMPFLLKVVPLGGPGMVILTMVVSILVAFGAALAAGLLSNLNTIPGILAAGVAVFGLSQLVYGLLKDKFAAYVK